MRKSELLVMICNVLFIIAISGCKTNSSTSEARQEMTKQSLTQLMVGKLGENAKCQPNKNNDFSLCISQRQESMQPTTLRFFIYDLKNGKIVFEPKEEYRKVFWEGDSLVKAYKFTRIPSPDSEQPVIYTVYKNKLEP